jgi:hypothetical protein
MALAGKLVLPIVFDRIPGLLGGSWEQRHAGLLSISSIAEGSADIMKQELAQIVE